MKVWLSRLDWAALVLELWALAKEKWHRRWEKEPDATNAILQQEATRLSIT